MRIHLRETEEQLGQAAADMIAQELNDVIALKGEANYLVSTGASQFATFEALVCRKDVDWTKVTMYHLDEYVGLPESHGASFRRYLRERFTDKVSLKRAVFIDGESNISETITLLENELAAHTIDVGVIGIGENAHIAFNDPPACFEKECAYHVVNLNDACKQQQVNEGWFDSLKQVPDQAISMTPRQIMRCVRIVSVVPGGRKANAIYSTLTRGRTDPMVPATLLLEHPRMDLFIDNASASLCSRELLEQYE